VEGASGETTEPLTKIVWLHSLWCTFPVATGTESTFDSCFVPGEQETIKTKTKNTEGKDTNREADVMGPP
jgi:hypothetical protein